MNHMHRALYLAHQAIGSVSPNPPVGALVIKNGTIVGEGWTQPWGQDHAEVVALRNAGPETSGSILYSTLEPCVHYGRTSPCTEMIVSSGITEVHAATIDPNPLVSGKGIACLNKSGVKTIVGEEEEDAKKIMEAYFKHVRTGFPFVTAKFAISLDGKSATRTGDSKWISNKESRQYANDLRKSSDAVIVGITTVLTDNPRLTVRDNSGKPTKQQPLRIVADSNGQTPEDALIFSQPGTTLIAVASIGPEKHNKLIKSGAEVKSFPNTNGGIDLKALLYDLGKNQSVTSVLIEGGGTLTGSMFDLLLVDKVVGFIAPTIIGGQSAKSPVSGFGVERIVESISLNEVTHLSFGDNIAFIGYC